MEKKESFTTGDYEMLAPQIVDLAYAMNDSYDLGNARVRADAEIAEHQGLSDNLLSSSLGELASSPLEDDELLVRYGEIIRKYSDTERIENFEKMMLLRAQLVPGEVIIYDSEVRTIATPNTEDSEEDITPVARPEIVANIASGFARHKLVWSVSVLGETERVRIDVGDIVGRDSIKLYLDDKNLDVLDIMRAIKVAQNYEAIGEKEAAARSYDECIINAAHGIEGRYLSSRVMRLNLQSLRDAGVIDNYLSGLTRRIALDSGKVIPTSELFTAVRALVLLEKVGEGGYERRWDTEPTLREVSARWAELERQGIAAIAEEESQLTY